MRNLLFILLIGTSGRIWAQQVIGGLGRHVPEKPIIDSTLTVASFLADDEVLLTMTVDTLCRIGDVRVTRDNSDGCGILAVNWARSMELDLMKYYKFRCPREVLLRCRCIHDD